ncbi:MAG: hypothetical protein ACXQTS_04000 [Candidatus Methanospirareceae archaeon]
MFIDAPYPEDKVRVERPFPPFPEDKVRVDMVKYGGIDDDMLEVLRLCYRYSPLCRDFLNSEHFGEVLGWRITFAWTTNVPKYHEYLRIIYPADLCIYAVRIDGILGNVVLKDFVKEGARLKGFRKFIEATRGFYSALRRDMTACQKLRAVLKLAKLKLRGEKLREEAIEFCKLRSPTFRKVLDKGKGDGWEIVKVWSDRWNEIEALRRVYPLDVAIYGLRLDSIIYGFDVAPAMKVEGIRLFPIEVANFAEEIR